jgi:hypothetical protein
MDALAIGDAHPVLLELQLVCHSGKRREIAALRVGGLCGRGLADPPESTRLGLPHEVRASRD